MIQWRNPESGGSVCLLSRALFTKNCEDRVVEHLTWWRGAEPMHARATLRVKGRNAWLNYKTHSAVNGPKGIYPDRLLLTFTDARRKTLETIHWNEAGTGPTADAEIIDATSKFV